MTLLWQYHTRTPIIASPTWTAESAAFPGRHYTVTVQADGRHFVIFPVGCFYRRLEIVGTLARAKALCEQVEKRGRRTSQLPGRDAGDSLAAAGQPDAAVIHANPLINGNGAASCGHTSSTDQTYRPSTEARLLSTGRGGETERAVGGNLGDQAATAAHDASDPHETVGEGDPCRAGGFPLNTEAP